MSLLWLWSAFPKSRIVNLPSRSASILINKKCKSRFSDLSVLEKNGYIILLFLLHHPVPPSFCLNTHNKLCKYGMLVLREVEEHLLCGCTRPPLQPSLLPPEVTPYLMQSMPPSGTWRITHAGEECGKCLTAFKVPSACKGERGASPCKTEKLFDE